MFYSLDEVREMDRLLAMMEAELRIADKRVAFLEERLETEAARLQVLQAEQALCKASIPGFLETHLGFCAGPYLGYSFTTNEPDAGAAVMYGWRF